jgi:hypothetical protein
MHENDTFDVEIPGTQTVANGHFVNPTPEIKENVKGNIQPAKGEDIMLLEEGDRGQEIKQIVTKEKLKINYNILFQGNSYKVKKMLADYLHLNSDMAHVEALIVKNTDR